MVNRKIVIDGCKECPMSKSVLMATLPATIRYICRHPHTDGMNVSDAVNEEIIDPDCPLEEDN